MKFYEYILGAAIAIVAVSLPIYDIYSENHRPYRTFILANGEQVRCRHMAGNLRYGIDLTDCESRVNIYDIGTEVREVRK